MFDSREVVTTSARQAILFRFSGKEHLLKSIRFRNETFWKDVNGHGFKTAVQFKDQIGPQIKSTLVTLVLGNQFSAQSGCQHPPAMTCRSSQWYPQVGPNPISASDSSMATHLAGCLPGSAWTLLNGKSWGNPFVKIPPWKTWLSLVPYWTNSFLGFI
jgi:hypothetical protein